MFYSALSELSADMLKYYRGFEAGEKPKADSPPEQHHFTVCLDLAEVAAFSSLFYSIQRYKTCYIEV
jgi:hypothetical protein